MEMRRIFSVVVCAVGIFFSMTAGSKDECLNSYVSADSLLLYEYYETYVMIRPLNYLRIFPMQLIRLKRKALKMNALIIVDDRC